MKGLDISEESLEDLLTYDDLFLDYFNAFLQLPTFPQRQYYNRLTGTFMELGGTVDSITGSVVMPNTPPYGATDDERERILEWAKEERLPLFLKTRLFREFKLCKLLMRPLDDRYRSASRGSSRNIRGYSRQTESYVSSLSNSADNSAQDATTDFEDYGTWSGFRRSALFRYQRPGSNAISLPPGLGLMPRSSSDSMVLSSTLSSSLERTKNSKNKQLSAEGKLDKKSRGGSNTKGKGVTISEIQDTVATDSGVAMCSHSGRDIVFTTRNDTLVSIDENEPTDSNVPKASSATEDRKSKSPNGNVKSSHTSKTQNSTSGSAADKRAISAPLKYDEFQGGIPPYGDYDVVYGEEEPEHTGETFVAFAEEPVSDQQTETDVRNLEGKHRMTLQQMKEQVLSQLFGMAEFKSFLADTGGIHLLNFWLDCEYFKDTMEDYDEVVNMAARNQLFRDIQDKYKISLTMDAKKKITKSATNISLSHTVFIRTQYDVLRRLRSYWLPRFLIHEERMNQLNLNFKKQHAIHIHEHQSKFAITDGTPVGTMFPSISVAKSLPVYPEDIIKISQPRSWDYVIKRGRQMEERIKSAKPMQPRIVHRTITEKLLIALTADREAGGPFRRFLERNNDTVLLSYLLFWEDVTEYGAAEDRSADRLLRMVHAWAIYNKYISPDSPYSIMVPPKDRNFLHQKLVKCNDFVEASVFDSAKAIAVEMLEKAWIRSLKEDLKKYIECHIRPPETPPSTAEEFEVIVEEDMGLVVRSKKFRPWVQRYPPSTQSERGHRLRTALSMAESIDDARRAEAKARARERRKQMEKERKKAIRAAKARQRELKKGGKPSKDDSPQEGGEEEDGGFPEDGQEEEKDATFIDMVSSNNKPVIGLFKKYLTEKVESKEATNQLNLYMDIDAYNNIQAEKGTTIKQKKDVQAGFINKTYFDSNGRKKVPMSDKVYSRLSHDKDRPKSATLREAQAYVLNSLEEHFSTFVKTQAEELGLDSKSLANMSQAEIAMRTGNDDALFSGWNKRKGKTVLRPFAGGAPRLPREESKLSLSNLLSRSPTDLDAFKLTKSKLPLSKSDLKSLKSDPRSVKSNIYPNEEKHLKWHQRNRFKEPQWDDNTKIKKKKVPTATLR